jgi:hypothetical protein
MLNAACAPGALRLRGSRRHAIGSSALDLFYGFPYNSRLCRTRAACLSNPGVYRILAGAAIRSSAHPRTRVGEMRLAEHVHPLPFLIKVPGQIWLCQDKYTLLPTVLVPMHGTLGL